MPLKASTIARQQHGTARAENEGPAHLRVAERDEDDPGERPNGKEEVVETLVVCEWLGGFGVGLGSDAEPLPRGRTGPGDGLHAEDVNVQQAGKEGEKQGGYDHVLIVASLRYVGSPAAPSG